MKAPIFNSTNKVKSLLYRWTLLCSSPTDHIYVGYSLLCKCSRTSISPCPETSNHPILHSILTSISYPALLLSAPLPLRQSHSTPISSVLDEQMVDADAQQEWQESGIPRAPRSLSPQAVLTDQLLSPDNALPSSGPGLRRLHQGLGHWC